MFKDVYDAEFIKNVYQSAVVSYQELKEDKVAYDGSVRIIYHTKEAYKRTAKMLGLMDDFKVAHLYCLSHKQPFVFYYYRVEYPELVTEE